MRFKVRKLETEKAANKKVLIITYYWPPAGGPGVQRVLKFVKYLPQFGWEPIVLTVKNGEYPAIDHSLEKDIPKGIKVYKTKTIEPFRIFKFLSGKSKKQQIATFILDQQKQSLSDKIFAWIRSNLFLPDARIGWFPFAYMKAKKIINSEAINIVFTSSPPHSLQLIGLRLKKYLKIKWVADFRDPWVDAFWEAGEKRTFYSQNVIDNQERKVFLNADKVITVSPTLQKRFEYKFSRKIEFIANGYDEDDIAKIEIKKSEKIVLRYFGSIARSQYPKNLFDFILKYSPDNLKIEFYGNFDQTLHNFSHNIDSNSFMLFNYLPHDKAIFKMLSSDILLLLIPKNRNDILTGKLFEYIGCGKPILCIGPKGDASDIIEKNNFGYHFDYDDDLYYFFDKNLNLLSSYEFSKEKQQLYSRKKQTKYLSQIFDSVC